MWSDVLDGISPWKAEVDPVKVWDRRQNVPAWHCTFFFIIYLSFCPPVSQSVCHIYSICDSLDLEQCPRLTCWDLAGSFRLVLDTQQECSYWQFSGGSHSCGWGELVYETALNGWCRWRFYRPYLLLLCGSIAPVSQFYNNVSDLAILGIRIVIGLTYHTEVNKSRLLK